MLVIRPRWVVSGLLVLWISAPPIAWADSQSAVPQGQDPVDEFIGRYNVPPALEKLGRGLSNALGGWLEIPLNIQQHYRQTDTAGSLFTGLGYGLVKGVVRTGVGVYEAVTFFLPYPEDFAPILPTLEYFQHTPRRRPLLLE